MQEMKNEGDTISELLGYDSVDPISVENYINYAVVHFADGSRMREVFSQIDLDGFKKNGYIEAKVKEFDVFGKTKSYLGYLGIIGEKLEGQEYLKNMEIFKFANGKIAFEDLNVEYFADVNFCLAVLYIVRLRLVDKVNKKIITNQIFNSVYKIIQDKVRNPQLSTLKK